MTDPPKAAECNTEAEATAGMGTVARMTRVRAAAKNAFTEPPSTIKIDLSKKNCGLSVISPIL